MFLETITEKNKADQKRFSEIRRLLAKAVMPGANEFGVALALKLPREIHERLEGIQSRHGIRSLKDAAYKAMMLGLATMERLPAESRVPTARPRTTVIGKVLSDAEIARIKEEGFGAPRVPVPPKHYCDYDEPEVRAAG